MRRRIALLAVVTMVAAVFPVAPAVGQETTSTCVFVNELLYDSTGDDIGEGIEIAGPAGTDLTGWSVVLYNGSGGVTYDTISLSGDLPDAGAGFGTLSFARAGIQNGPDGLAVVDAADQVIQFLSYEGVFTAADGPAAGMTSTDIGRSQAGSPLGFSLQLTGTGSSYEDFVWNSPAEGSFGAINSGQTFEEGACEAGEAPPPPPPSSEGLKINEIDYDQPSTDTAEFVEIYNGTDAVDLAGFQLRFVNGSTGSVYDTIALSGTLGAGDFFVACANAATTPNCDLDDNPDTNFIQNGAPDAVALVETATETIVDTVSYEGETSAPYTEGTGAVADPGEVAFVSISRIPDGTDTDDNSADFTLVCTTPGTANASTGEDCADPNPPPGNGNGDATACLFINEFHYDNEGADTGEATEVAGTPGNLEGYSLLLYNGSNGSVYNTTALTGSITDQQNGHGTAVFPISGIQNGAPDGIALVDPDGAVLQFLSYEGTFTAGDGPAAGRISRDIGVAEDDPVAAVDQSLQLTGADNQSFTWTEPATSSFGSPNAGQTFGGDCPTPEAAPDPTPTDVTIPEIQGATHFSEYDGMLIRTSGVVTATDSNGARGFYLQDPIGDGDDPAGRATSDAIFVFTGAASGVAVGDEVTVEGTVSEFIPGGAFTRNLPTTQISADSVVVESSDNPLPAPVVIGEGGRLPPTEIIEDDNFGSFDPTTDGMDFLEAVEAMLVTVKAPTMVGGTTFFGELFVMPAGVTPTQMSQRGTLNISPDDFNPERIQIDPDTGVFDIDAPFVDTGAVLSDVTGVVGYAFGSFEVIPTQTFSVVTESTLAPETTALRAFGTTMTVASYNVLNLDPNDHEQDEDERDTDIADGRFEAVAFDIVQNLGSPDIVALQEVQDNSGADNDGVTSADETLQLLVDEIAALGGPDYVFIDNPFIGNNTSGGQPGANIRVAYLYNPHRVTPVGEPETVVDPADQQVNPANPFWDTRLPLVQTFDFMNRHVMVVNNHFASKSGSAPLYGTAQNSTERQEDPTVNGSLDQRQAQALAVRDYLAPALADGANAVVLGDFNEFEFISPLDPILSQNLVNLTLQLGADERYSYIFEGNSQSLDHILVSEGLNPWATFDAVHVNAEFAGTSSRASDHDPLIASIDLARVAPVPSRRPMTPPGGGIDG